VIESLKSSSLITGQKPLNLNKIKDGHLISKVLVELITCKCGIPILDGSNFSDMRINSSSMSKTSRFSMLQVEEIKKVTMFKSGERMDPRPNNGLFSMKTKKRRPRLKV
jgi:hypothetical protein